MLIISPHVKKIILTDGAIKALENLLKIMQENNLKEISGKAIGSLLRELREERRKLNED